MIAARQELDLRPQLERLDRLICWSEDIDEGALSFAFRPLWQLDEPAKAALALSRAQATQVYAGLKLWPDAAMAKLAEAQLVADGTYPNAVAVFAKTGATNPASASLTLDYDPAQPRDLCGRWTSIGAGDLPEASITRPPGKPAGPSASVAQVFPPDIFFEDPPVVPDPGIPYPTDPTLPPGPDYIWKGPPGSMPGDPRGSWFNPKTGESLHPDLDHEPGVDPHYDYKIRRFKNKGWRWFPYGMVPKA